jgi:hypothetical protein
MNTDRSTNKNISIVIVDDSLPKHLPAFACKMTNVAGTGSDVQTKKYTKFIIALVDEITSDIFDKLKYALHYVIPSATMEKLLNPLDLFKELEKRHIVGPENLDELRDYLEMIQEQDLMFMLDNFACSCGISRSKATAKKPLKNYLIMNHYYLKIKGGQHYSSESVGEYVELTSGNSYALVVKNPLFHRCRCTIKIDGHVVFPGYIINPRQSVTIERPCQRNGKFRFFSLEHAPSGSGINKWKSENGLVEVTFTPERADMTVVCRVSNENCSRCLPLTCSNQTTDVGLLKMILSAFHFLEAMAFSVHFGCKPIGHRNIKLTEYGIYIY